MRSYVAEDSPTIEDGIYTATVQKIEDMEGGQYGPALKFIFDVDVDGDNQELSALCSDPEHFTPKTKLRRWATAILNREITDGEKFSPKMLMEKACRVLVKNEENERGTWAKIKDVLPASKPKAKKRAEPVDEDSEEEPF